MEGHRWLPIHEPPRPSQWWADRRRRYWHEGALRAYHGCRGRVYAMKVDVALCAAIEVLPVLDRSRDRVQIAHFSNDYWTLLAPTHDFGRIGEALRGVRSAATRVGPRGSAVFLAAARHINALSAHSHDRTQVSLLMTDGGDNSLVTAREAGEMVGRYCDADPLNHRFELICCGTDGAVDFPQLGAFRASAGGRCMTLLGDVYSLAPLVRRTLYQATAAITGVRVEAGEVSLQLLRASLAVERRGIDLCLCFDTSPSMRGYTASPRRPGGGELCRSS